MKRVKHFALVMALFSTTLTTGLGWSQTSRRSVVVTRAKGAPVRVAEPKVQVWSSDGYVFGGSFQTIIRLLITDPVVAPEGVKLKPREIEWNRVRKIEWSAPPAKGVEDHRIEKVTFQDGRTESVFIWRKMSGDSHERFYSCQLHISGKMSLGGKDQDIEIGESEAQARSCSSSPITSIEFTE